MSVLAIVIARMGSTRLPGKVLMELGHAPVLKWVVMAAISAPFVDEVMVATTTEPLDHGIEEWCNNNGIRVYRGSEHDVLARVAGAAREYQRFLDATNPDQRNDLVVVRLTGDCPFLDPDVIGAVVRLQQETGCAYASNVDPRTWPDGLDCEAFTAQALFAADFGATRPIDRECVTTFIQRNRSRFPAQALICPLPGLAKERWVLDTPDDYEFCQELAEELHRFPANHLDILDVLDRRPELREINAHHPVNERYYEAIANEPLVTRSYARSQEALERALQVIPLAAQTFSKSHVQFPQPSPLFLSHGQGGIVWDIDGNEYVDLVSALLPNILGYRDHDVDTAVRCQLANGISFSLATELEAQLAETLVRLIPCAEMVRFGKNGSDVTTAAVRLARAFTGRDRVLICDGYHGWHDWSIAGTERDLGVPHALRLLKRRVSGDQLPLSTEYAAVIVEPETNPDYLKVLRTFCHKSGTVLIFDEIITGFRFDLGGAQKLYGVTPDLACFGKAMANGMPLSALVGRADIMRKLEPPNPCVFFSGTFGGETLSLAAAIATIAKLERELIIPKLWATGSDLAYKVNCLLDEYGLGDQLMTHGSAPLVRLKFTDPRIEALFRREMIASGTLIIASHNICAAHGPNEIKRVLRSYAHTFDTIRHALDFGPLGHAAIGDQVRP